MKIKVITESGSYYHIDTVNKRWSKNGDYLTRLALLMVGKYKDRNNAFGSDSSWTHADVPEVGLCMYLAEGLSYSWSTTEVVEIIENPNDWDEVANRD